MARIRQSFCWWCFARAGEAPDALLRAAAEIGYEAVDLVEEAHWPAIREHGMRISAVMGHQSLTDGLNRRENHSRIERQINEALATAEKWGILNLVCFSGNRNGLDDLSGAVICAEGLRRVSRRAEDAGVNLVLELLNSKVDHRDYQCDRTQWGVAVCEMVASPRVLLLNDLYHMQIMEGDLIRNLQTHAAHIGHYHTAGNPGRRDLDDAQEIAYPAVMRAILATGYEGYVAHEFVPRGAAAPALRAAYHLCDVSL